MTILNNSTSYDLVIILYSTKQSSTQLSITKTVKLFTLFNFVAFQQLISNLDTFPIFKYIVRNLVSCNTISFTLLYHGSIIQST